MKVHVHEWKLTLDTDHEAWTCVAPDHVHSEPDIIDASTIWHVLGVIKTHKLVVGESFLDGIIDTCECGATGDYYEHLDDAVYYWLKDIDERV